ncbi:MAG: hypothetical protein D6797_08065 [Bdellovibrio sp.]|nr:MAG: hypothetical protein D6797_08065 [Bdellovibrio sp.]
MMAILLLGSQGICGGWSVNMGYHNPHTSTIGVNFMHVWDPYVVEAGLGYIRLSSSSDDISGINLGGGVNGKYLFRSGLFRPYLQAGFGMSSGVSGDGAGFGVSGFFLGGGLLVMDSSFYIYSSYNLSEGYGSGFLQFGVGFNL